MRFHRSLRYRVAFTFAWFGGLVSLLLASGLYFAAHDLGQRLIDETLSAELQDYMARRARNPHSLPPATVTVLGYVQPHGPNEPEIPPEVGSLPPGQHKLLYLGTPYRVAVVDRDSTRFFMLHNVALQQRREGRFFVFLGTGILVMTLLSAAGGLWLAGRVIAPVTELSRRVHELDPQDRPVPLAKDFSQDEVGELARVFDRYHTQLRAFVEREREFTADVSHELRTPLAVVQGATEVLLADDSLPEKLRERIARAERAAHDMAQLTTALLLMARENRASAPPAGPCSVAEVLQDAVEKHRYLLRDKPVQVELELHAQPRLAVERTLLFIVLGNLIRNAFSYTEKGEIRITLDTDRATVTDTGSGIRADELNRVFQRHYKGPSSQGAGIGLSLVKRICDRYGWHIAIDSREGVGTVAQMIFTASPEPDSTNS